MAHRFDNINIAELTFDPVTTADLYKSDSRRQLDHVPDPSVPDVDEEDGSQI